MWEPKFLGCLGTVHFLWGGGGWWDWGGGHPKKIGLKGGASQKNIVCKGGVTKKITLKCCNNSIYDGAKFSTKMP